MPSSTDGVRVVDVAESARIDISTDPEQPGVRLDDEPVDEAIRSAEVTAAVSAVSAYPAVRALLVALQRELIEDGGIVVEGRDIGTVVWPTAYPKVYLTADPRPGRSVARPRPGGWPTSPRWPRTSTGATASTPAGSASPLSRAADAVELDTTELDIDEVVERLLDLTGTR